MPNFRLPLPCWRGKRGKKTFMFCCFCRYCFAVNFTDCGWNNVEFEACGLLFLGRWCMTRSAKLRIFAKIYPLSGKLWKVATCFWMLIRYLSVKVIELITVRQPLQTNESCNCLVTAESNVSFGCFCLIILFDRAVSTVPIAMPSD